MQRPRYRLCSTPQCIVGVGAAERSHLLQDNSNVLSPEEEGGREEKQKKRKERETGRQEMSTLSVDKRVMR